MINLDTLNFAVETRQLDEALTKINALGAAMGDVTRASERATRASTNESNARRSATQGTQAQADSTNASTNATRQNISALEKQQKILQYMTEGFSRGQSSILATANAAGVATTELQELGKVLQTQRKLIGGDTFDKSLSGLIAMKNQLGELREANRLYSAGIEMSSSQTRELARDKERIIEKMKLEGATLTEIKDALKQHNAEYIKAATAVNALAQAEKNSQAEIKKSENALNRQDQALAKLTKELERSQRAVEGLNDGMQVSNSNRLLNFERLLKASGVSAAEASTKLAAYKQNLEAVQKVQQQQDADAGQRRRDFLSRSLAPQASDTIVSIAGGMPIMTVLLQQGAQVRDLIQQSGVGANELGSVLRQTGEEFVGTLMGAANAVGSLLAGIFQSAASGVTDFISGLAGVPELMQGLGQVTQYVNTQLQAMGINTSSLNSFFSSLQPIITNLSKMAVTSLAASFTAVALAAYQVTRAVSDMNDALILNGAATGLSKESALELAKNTNVAGSTLVDVIEVFGQLANAGGIPKEVFSQLSESMLNLSKVSSKSVQDMVKEYKELAKDPVVALEKLAVASGNITAAEIERVKQLVEIGSLTDAVTLATDLYTKSLDASTQQSIMSASGLTNTWRMLKEGIFEAWKQVQQFASSTEVTYAFDLSLKVVVGTLLTINALLRGIGIVGLGAYNVLVGLFTDISNFDLDFSKAKAATADFASAIKGLSVDYETQMRKTFEMGEFDSSLKKKQLEDIAKLRKANSDGIKLSAKQEADALRSVEEVRKAAAASGDRETLRALNGIGDVAAKEKIRSDILKEQKANLAKLGGENKNYSDSLERINRGLATGAINAQQAKESIESLNKVQPKSKPAAQNKEVDTFFETSMGAFRKQAVDSKASLEDLTDAHKKYLEVIGSEKYAKLSDSRKREIGEAYQAAQAVELLADKEELRLKAMKDLEDAQLKSLGFTANYAEQIKLLNYALDNNAISTEDYGRVLEFIQKNQPYYKDAADAVKKLNEEGDKLLNNLDEQLASELGIASSIELQLLLMGKTEAESKKAIGLLKIKLDYEKEIAEIQAKATGITPEKKLELESKALDIRRQKELNLNSEISFDAAKKQFEEFEKIQKDISDVITTALIEGGKAGATRLKDILKNALNKRITVFIDAVVKDVTGGFFGGSGGATGQAGGKTGGGFNTLSNLASGISSFATVGSQVVAGTMSVANALGTVAANATGTGISGLLATNGAFGTAAGASAGVGAGMSAAMAAAGPYVLAALTVAALAKPLFGRKLKDSGIEGTFGGTEGFQGNRFEFMKGGVFRSDKTNRSALDAEVQNYLAESFKSLRVQVGTFATALGLNADKIADFNSSIKLSLKGLSPEDAQKKIEETFGKVGDELASIILDTNRTIIVEEVFQVEIQDNAETGRGGSTFVDEIRSVIKTVQGSGKDFSKAGETSSQTLQRLATSLMSVNAVFDTLGRTALSASLESSDLASKILDSFGNIEIFNSANSAYFDKFYTEEEKLSTGVRQLGETFTKLGLVLPDVASEDAVKQFRRLVDAQQLTTEEGRNTYAALIKLAPVFSDIVVASSSANQALKELFSNIANMASDASGQLLNEVKVGNSKDYIATALAMFRAGKGAMVEEEKLKSSIDFVTTQGTSSFKTAFDYQKEKLIQSNTLKLLSKEATEAGNQPKTQLELIESSNEIMNKQIKAIEDNTIALSSGQPVTSAVDTIIKSNKSNDVFVNNYTRGDQSDDLVYTYASNTAEPRMFDVLVSGASSNNSSIVEQLELMRYELRANVIHTSKLAKQLDRLIVPTNSGDALQTKAVA